MCRGRVGRASTLPLVFVVLVASGAWARAVTPIQDAAPAQDREEPAVRFSAVDVFVDSGDEPLAAYQFELVTEAGDVTIVGVEGGEHPAFAEPPYYDPAALHAEGRIIIAAFDTGDELPVGKTRVARIHIQISVDADPQVVVKLAVAASPDGAEIQAVATAVVGEDR